MTIILWYHKTSTQYILLPAVLPSRQFSVLTLFSALNIFDLGSLPIIVFAYRRIECSSTPRASALTCFITNMKNVQWDVHVQQLRASPVQPICDIVIFDSRVPVWCGITSPHETVHVHRGIGAHSHQTCVTQSSQPCYPDATTMIATQSLASLHALDHVRIKARRCESYLISCPDSDRPGQFPPFAYLAPTMVHRDPAHGMQACMHTRRR
jgi:hypothetical protein